jgi:hypothetical protein
MKTPSRRQFLKTSALIGMPAIIPASVLGDNAPSKRITLGCIGVGGQGTANLNSFLNQADARVVAVCDVFSRCLRVRDD